MQVYSSISGIPFYAPSAGYAPTNGSDVSAIASAYRVVSATATQLNAGTAYVTSINETQLSAARAGNAANATQATSAWYDGTGRLISSLPDSAAVSGIASAYAESAASGKEDAITYGYDAGNAISSINGSALAGGGGGGGGVDSATVSAIASSYAESAASSKLDESATADFYSTSNPSGYATTAYVDSSVSGKQDTLAFNYHYGKISAINGSAIDTGRSVVTSTASGIYVTALWYNQTSTGISHINNSSLIAAYAQMANTDPKGNSISSCISTVSSNSATWGAGGVDSATVSAIASAYVESGMSGKLNESATADFYSTSNPSGFITGVDLSTYATTAYVDSSVSGKLDSTAFNSGDFYSTSNPSGFISGVNLDGYATTSYVESSVSSKADSSALSSYALSADVSGTVDIVSSQSANWGGSALALSAGPGVKLEKVDDTLVAGLDEIVLWSGNITASNGTGTLAYPPSAFADLKVEWYGENTGEYGLKCSYFHNDGLNFSGLACGGIGEAYNNYAIGHHFGYLTLTNNTVTLIRQCRYNLTTTGLGAFDSGNGMFRVQRIVGINRTAEA